MGICRDCVSAGVAMPWEVINEIIGEMRSKRGHRAPARKRSSLAAAMVRIRTGVASRYQ